VAPAVDRKRDKSVLPAQPRSEASSIVVPISRLPSLVLGLLIGVGVATAGYVVLMLLAK
jgi:hypothetical protein